MADREKKIGEGRIQKFEHLENGKSFLDEMKLFFIVFLGLLFGKK